MNTITVFHTCLLDLEFWSDEKKASSNEYLMDLGKVLMVDDVKN